jgi:hypothetical protein
VNRTKPSQTRLRLPVIEPVKKPESAMTPPPAELKLHVVKEITALSDEQFLLIYSDLLNVLHPGVRQPRFGSAKGLLQFIADDFDAPLPEFADYMP